MSQLQQLKQQINGLGRAARRTGQELSQLDSAFAQQSAQVQATIGGSAQSKDRVMTASIQEAKTKVHAAVEALARLSQTANQYAASL